MTNTALITGASSGIGATYADRLARRGHDLILVARDTARLQALADTLHAATGRNVEVLTADLGKRGDLAAVETRLADDPAITLLVNNAGIAVGGPMHQADVERLDAMIQLNVVAAMRLAHAAVRNFTTHGRGTLINIASVLALAPERFNGVYAGSKSFLLTLSQNLQAELRGTGIRVQAVLPGATRTEIWDKMGATPAAANTMEVGDLVDAALAGLDQGEAVTIPSMADAADWQRFDAARLALGPHLSRNVPAGRYTRMGAAA